MKNKKRLEKNIFFLFSLWDFVLIFTSIGGKGKRHRNVPLNLKQNNQKKIKKILRAGLISFQFISTGAIVNLK